MKLTLKSKWAAALSAILAVAFVATRVLAVGPELTLTATNATIAPATLIPATNGIPADNSAVTAAVSGLSSIAVTLSNTGDTDSDLMRIPPIGDTSGHLQLWAQDSSNNWYDVNVTGWGPGTGFPVNAGANSSLSIYAISDVASTYTADVKVVLASDGTEVTHASGTINVVDNTSGGGGSPTPTGPSTLYVGTVDAPSGVIGTETNPYTTIGAAVVSAHDGDTILVKGEQTVTTAINVNKKLTIDGQDKQATILTSGTSYVFVTTASDVTIKGFVFNKTDSLNKQYMINVQGVNNHIENNSFSGQYIFGANETSGGLEVSTTTGLKVTGNEFKNLRQPAYINDNTQGVIENNYTDGTKGWVVVGNSTLNFTGNTWGTNAVDIAIIPSATNNYQNLVTINAANNNAVIINKAFTTPLYATSYVNADISSANADLGSPMNPFHTLNDAVAGTIEGGTIVVQSDITGTATVNIGKKLTINGNGHTLTASFAKIDSTANSAINIHDVTGVTINGLKEDGTGGTDLHGINIFNATVTLNDVSVSNNPRTGVVVNGSDVTVNNISTSNNGWGGIDVDQGVGVTSIAKLTVTGTSTHSETAGSIIKDDNLKTDVSVVDSVSQYDSASFTHDVSVTGTKYTLKPIVVPTTPSGGGGGGVSGGGGAVFTATTPATSTVTTTAPVGQVLGAETFNFTKTLKMGATGDEVVQLQNRLATDGYTLVNDGKFGPKTKAALIKWQKAHGLVADGVVGPKTRAALNK